MSIQHRYSLEVEHFILSGLLDISSILGTDHYFLSGGGGVTIFGTCRQFFSESDAFQTIFFITFGNENNFFTTILKNVTGFFIDLI